LLLMLKEEGKDHVKFREKKGKFLHTTPGGGGGGCFNLPVSRTGEGVARGELKEGKKKGEDSFGERKGKKSAVTLTGEQRKGGPQRRYSEGRRKRKGSLIDYLGKKKRGGKGIFLVLQPKKGKVIKETQRGKEGRRDLYLADPDGS